MFEVKLIL